MTLRAQCHLYRNDWTFTATDVLLTLLSPWCGHLNNGEVSPGIHHSSTFLALAHTRCARLHHRQSMIAFVSGLSVLRAEGFLISHRLIKKELTGTS